MYDIFIAYKGEVITMPVNPEEVAIERPSNNDNAEVIGVGEINIIKKPKLMSITLESFWPKEENPRKYINFFNKIYEERQPCRIILKEMGINMMISIDNFEHSERAGEEGDVYYTLDFQQWRDYSPRKITKKKEEGGGDVEEPRVEQPEPKKRTYKVKKGDCLWNIAKKYTGKGSRWPELYNLNKKKIGKNPNLIYPGQVFNIPKGW